MSVTTTSQHLTRLRRGTVVQIRGDGLIQVGSDPARRALLPDTNAVRGILHVLSQGARLATGPGTDGVVTALRESGVLVEPELEALLRDARACTTVHVDVPAPWHDGAAAVLRTAGLGIWSGDGEPDLVLRWGSGAGARGVRTPGVDVPVLHVAVQDGRLCVGPFVSAGDTACPECIETHLRDRDPFRPVTVTHPERTFLPQSATDIAEVDALMVQHGLLLAADDLRAWAEGRQPRSWSATVRVDRHLSAERRVWTQHPSCGCAWLPEG